LIDLINEFPAQPTAQALVDSLQALQPRLYSIACSQQLQPDEVHLTVSALQYEAHGRSHQGSASGHLSTRLTEDDITGVYLAENSQFRLPEDHSTPIIMIGAGTGIAPYRAFLQQRQADAASGKNWLIFGNRHFRRDFLYQQDWINLRKAGVLNRVSLAFSRDTTTRAYIQHRLLEDGAEIYQWLQQGARLYVCGGMAMEQAVQQAINEIAVRYGAADAHKAETFIENLRAQGRYLRDVY
jgi:sulfite reductase (NADPH) flavoprotein alpha-component